VLDGDSAPPPPKGHSPPIYGPYLLRPKGCIDQDATWYGGRHRPRRLCVRWRPRSPSPKRWQNIQIFGPCLLWPNGWMDHDGTWHGEGLSPGNFVLDGDRAPSQKRGPSPPPQLSAHFYSGQTAGCIKMPLGMEVDLSQACQGDFVLDGIHLPKKGAEPLFPPIFFLFVVPQSPGNFVLDWESASPLSKKGADPPIFGPYLLRPNGCMDQDATWYGGRPRFT